MTNSKGKLFSGYVFADEERKQYFALKNRPDEFIKYGLYEMRRMDKRLIEAGCVTKAKVKYWGGGFAEPYLWKPDVVKDEKLAQSTRFKLKDNSEYCQSWSDPREKIFGTTQVESQNVGQTANNEHAQSVFPNNQSLGESFSDVATNFGYNIGNALADGASTVGGLFDINPSPTEEQQSAIPKKKPKNEKKRGIRR